MVNFYLLLASTFMLLGCSNAPAAPALAKAPPVAADSAINYATFNINTTPTGTYLNQCVLLKNTRQQLSAGYINGQITLDSAGRYFTNALVNTLLPHWYGTKWSFEGHASQPGNGEIACSYLVSTSLSHAGLNINRYKVAQQTPLNEALTYACGDTVYTLYGPNQVIDTLQHPTFANGLYFIGLAGSHVGLLLKQQNNLFFIHSNYVAGQTEIEVASASTVLRSYSVFYITAISTNKQLMQKWLGNQPVEIKM